MRMIRRNIIIQILVKENLTDPRYVEFRKYWNFTEEEFNRFNKTITETKKAYNELAYKIVRFLVDYKDGALVPDKYNFFEPLKKEFDKDDISRPVSLLSFPGGSLYLRKKNKYYAKIENDYYSILWKEIAPKKNELLISKRVLPPYMGKIQLWFSKRRKIDMEFLKCLLKDYCEYINSDRGFIYDQETMDVLYDIADPDVMEKGIKHDERNLWYDGRF